MRQKINPKLKKLYEKNNRFFIILSVLLFIILSYFIYKYGMELKQVKTDINILNQTQTAISNELNSSTVDFTTNVKLYSEKRTEHLNELSRVFPREAEKTDFTRMIDNYFFKNNFTTNEIFLKNLLYGKAQKIDNAYVIPVNMSITSSKENFIKFLTYVENSGAMQSNVRIMDIESINVTFRDTEDSDTLFDYRISLNMYYQETN